MLERLVSDLLVRVLGQYVHGITPETVRVGVWSGDLELHKLALRPDALAVLFETLGLDLPVTVSAGYIGTLSLKVPWKSIRSSPVLISLKDISVVASPVSDGDQEALVLRDARLKAARLDTDDAVREARRSVDAATNEAATQNGRTNIAQNDLPRLTRWRRRVTDSIVSIVVNNIQVDVENIIIQYQDASSVRARPYTVSLNVESIRAVSTNKLWEETFVTENDAESVFKVLYLKGLVANWETGIGDTSHAELTPAEWSEAIKQSASRRVIYPLDGDLRIALAAAGSLHSGARRARVQMDLCLPDVRLGFDDFQYHTLLSTIMYLSDIDRQVRPKSPKARWLWALERLLPRFKERHEARLRFTAEGLRERREQRELYVRARKTVVTSKQQGMDPGCFANEVSVLRDMELVLSCADVFLFRDIADTELRREKDLLIESSKVASGTSGIWKFLPASRPTGTSVAVLNRQSPTHEDVDVSSASDMKPKSGEDCIQQDYAPNSESEMTSLARKVIEDAEASAQEYNGCKSNVESFESAPSFCISVLICRGSIQLSSGGFPDPPLQMSRLVFRELRLGVTIGPVGGMLIEGLLGTLDVLDLRNNANVMYPRVRWAGRSQDDDLDEVDGSVDSKTAGTTVNPTWHRTLTFHSENGEAVDGTEQENAHAHCLRSYPNAIASALQQIHSGYEKSDPSLFKPSESGLETARKTLQDMGLHSDCSSSTGSLLSDGGSPLHVGRANREDLTRDEGDALDYLVALRLRHERVTDTGYESVPTRLAMDLAIGGMEAVVDNPTGTFVSSLMFWHPREKLPSIMQFLNRAAAPRLATLRMNIQRLLLDKKAPMRMDIIIRGPRFIIPGPSGRQLSLVVDFGTFAMETAKGATRLLPIGMSRFCDKPGSETAQLEATIDVHCTDYRMSASDLGVFIVSAAGRKAAERLVRPFSLRLLLQVLNDASYIETIADEGAFRDLSRMRLHGQLSSVKTIVSHSAFRQLLEIIYVWSSWTRPSDPSTGTEPCSRHSSHGFERTTQFETSASSLAPVKTSDRKNAEVDSALLASEAGLASFEMRLEFDDLRLELRDITGRRIVTVSTEGTAVKFVKHSARTNVDYRVRMFLVEDGSRGATAPFRRLLHAGYGDSSTKVSAENFYSSPGQVRDPESLAFVHVSYIADDERREQELSVHVLSLSMVCVRETYLALADFFYMVRRTSADSPGQKIGTWSTRSEECSDRMQGASDQDGSGLCNIDEYNDPFVALGMTTSTAVRALREQAERGVEMSKQAFARRGQLKMNARLDGLDITLITAEGAIASFDVRDCSVRMVQSSKGSISAEGEFGSIGVRDLTASFDVHAQPVSYRRCSSLGEDCARLKSSLESKQDGWALHMADGGDGGEVRLSVCLTNLRIVYVQRFIIILKKYLSALRDELEPVLAIKGGISDVFDAESDDSWKAMSGSSSRFHVDIIADDIDVIMPRHSQSPHEALRFCVGRSTVTNNDLAAPGYVLGFRLCASDISAYVLYGGSEQGYDVEGADLEEDPDLEPLSFASTMDLSPFSEKMQVVAKIDVWRCRRVPQVVLNEEGIPVLKDGELEMDYDPQQWLPALRARVSFPRGICVRLCEAEYSILYFTFTENIIERPDIEFTDIVRGLKTPVLPPRRPIEPIMLSSNRLPPNYSIVFEVPSVSSIIAFGADPKNSKAHLIDTELARVSGRFDYGVDSRMTLEVSCDISSMRDLRPVPKRHPVVIQSLRDTTKSPLPCEISPTPNLTLSWDRPHGHRANVMIVVSDVRLVVIPELFRDLGRLTSPGFPYLKSSAPAPMLRFNGRLLIVTLSRPEVWLIADQFEGDGRSVVLRGDIIAKVQWAAVTGRNLVEVASKGVRIGLSNSFSVFDEISADSGASFSSSHPMCSSLATNNWRFGPTETPLVYPLDISLSFHAGGYDPPESPSMEPVKAPGSSLSVDAESVLGRIDVNDVPVLLAVASGLIRLRPSSLSRRPIQPGRFDEWIDRGEDGDAKFSIDLSVPTARVLFTHETSGRCIPIMEARARNWILRSNVPWMTHAKVHVSLDLFNESQGWWEPGVERFPVEITGSQGRSGSTAVSIRTIDCVEINVTPSTVSGAARVAKTIKFAVDDLLTHLKDDNRFSTDPTNEYPVSKPGTSRRCGKRPSVAAFCVQNRTGRAASVWLPYDPAREILRGDGGETEMDLPTDEVLWPSISALPGACHDANRNRHSTLRCYVAFTGYESVILSAAEVGIECITLMPENVTSSTREIVPPNSLSPGDACQPLDIVWDVTMRDGVPMGCLRSTLRIVNETRTVLEVYVGRKGSPLSTSLSMSSLVSTAVHATQPESSKSRALSLAVVEAGGNWCVPVHLVDRPLRIRPALFHAPEDDRERESKLENGEEVLEKSSRQRVLYSYSWSDVLDCISSHHAILKTPSLLSRSHESRIPAHDGDINSSPVLTCSSLQNNEPFFFSLVIEVGNDVHRNGSGTVDAACNWVDIRIRAPLVVQNLLPRCMSYAIADERQTNLENGSTIVAKGYIEPLKEAHIHSVVGGSSSFAFGLGYNNFPSQTSSRSERDPPPKVTVFHHNVLTLDHIPVGPIGDRKSLTFRLDHSSIGSVHRLTVCAEYWIQNRSDIGIFFRDRFAESRRSGSDKEAGPKTFLRACSPGKRADSYVCFSGPWLALQRIDATEDVWIDIGEDISEIDKPIMLGFEGLGLALDVRPAKGKGQRALIVTVRNTGWLENRTSLPIQWCQPAALSYRGIVLSSRVHTITPMSIAPLHWDFLHEEKAVCLRLASEDGTSDWIWSRPVTVEGAEGEFAAKMYRPKRHEQYIARTVISKLRTGTCIVTVHPEDRGTPPYRIVNMCANRSVAFRQAGADETHPWLVRPGKTTRYSWDDPRAPLKRRTLVVEIIETKRDISRSSSKTSLSQMAIASPMESSSKAKDTGTGSSLTGPCYEIRYPKFTLSIDAMSENVEIPNADHFFPPLQVSVSVDGPTKVVTFSDVENLETDLDNAFIQKDRAARRDLNSDQRSSDSNLNLDVELSIEAIGVSLVDSKPVELAYVTFSGVHFRLDRFDSSELIVFDIIDVQVDNQLSSATYPVALWSPLSIPSRYDDRLGLTGDARNQRIRMRKPVFQLIVDGKYPRFKDGISRFRGVFAAVQQLELSADEELVLRLFLYVQSLIAASGEIEQDESENISDSRQDETDLAIHVGLSASSFHDRAGSVLVQRLYVEQLELCPLKLTVSFTSSRSPALVRVAGYRTLIRTLMAVFGNVEHAEFRLNALELRHAFDSTHHFKSLISEFYVGQALSQKMALLTSNPLVGNPSALFDSIAIGTRDFFVEPSRAKGSAEFIAGIGRGSSSLLTNTVGGIVGSLGGIPRAVAQGLETAVGDKDYLAERDSIRGRGRVSATPAQGLFTGAMSFGHGIASGAAGLVREPVRGAMQSGPSGFIKGLGKGFIGGLLKPITGALDLIGEPAVGFHSMMTTGNRDFAEPVRPARAFWGSGSRRLVAYDMHAALGQALLNAVGNFQEEAIGFEELRAWTPLVAVPDGTVTSDLVTFLWALHRRSAPSSKYRSKAVLDGRGEPQRADRMRCALVTQLRLIISSMDGRVIWEIPLRDIVDTQVPLDTTDALLVGVHPRIDYAIGVPPSSWEKILCGSPSRRDELNEAIKKGIAVFRGRRMSHPWIQNRSVGLGIDYRKVSMDEKEASMSSIGASVSPGDVEMTDLSISRNECSEFQDVGNHDLDSKFVHRHLTSSPLTALHSRGPTHYPGRSSRTETVGHEMGLREICRKYPRCKSTEICRSFRMFVVNRLSRALGVVRLELRCGVWKPNNTSDDIAVSGLQIFEANDGGDRVSDVAGCIVLQVRSPPGSEIDIPGTIGGEITLRFMNPMLGGNAFAITAPDGIRITREGGDNGEEVDVFFSITEL